MPSFISSAKHLRGSLVLMAALLLWGCSASPEERAQRFYDRGMQFVNEHDDVKARIELRNAVQAKADMLPAWRALAALEERAGNMQAVFAASRQIAEADPKDAPARLRLARLALLAGQFDDALKRVNEIIDLENTNLSALTLRAAVLLKLNDNSGAIREAQGVLKSDPANVEAMMVLAAEKFSREDFKAALGALEGIPQERQNELGVLLFKIKCFERLQDYPAIEASLRKLVEDNPKEMAFKRELIRFYVSQKRTDDAEREMRAIVAAMPADTALELELVRFLQVAKGPAAARAELNDKIKRGGAILPFQIALAELDYLEGNFEQSRRSLESLIESEKSAVNVLTLRTKLGEFLFAKKDFAAVDAQVAEILKSDSRNLTGLKLRASLRIERGQIDDAIADLRQALNDQPRSPDLLSLLALAYEHNGAIELADKQLSDAMRFSNYVPSFGLNYVAFLQRRGLAGPAENVLTDLASRNPANVDVLSALAQAMLAKQNWVGAQQVADAIRKLGNRGGRAEQIQAAVFSGQQKYEESVGILESAYNANPDALQPMFALVRTYLQAQKVDKAESFLQSVLKANPDNSEANVLVGLTYLTKNAPDQAEQSFKTAIERQPKNPIGYRALSDFYVNRRNLDGALQVINTGLQQVPDNVTLRLSRAGVLELKGEIDLAISEYDELLKQDPGSMVVINNLASLVSDYRPDKASLDRAFKLAAGLTKSQVPQFKDTLGWLYSQRGENRTALPLLEEAAAQMPNVPTVRYHLGMTYKNVDQKEKASEQLKKALELSTGNQQQQQKIKAALAELTN